MITSAIRSQARSDLTQVIIVFVAYFVTRTVLTAANITPQDTFTNLLDAFRFATGWSAGVLVARATIGR